MSDPWAAYKERVKNSGLDAGYIDLWTSIRRPDDELIQYTILSISPLEQPRLAAQQKLDASLSLVLRGEVTHPHEFKGYKVEAEVNNLGSIIDYEYGTPNALGDGWLTGNTFSFQIVVPPHVVKDTLEQLHRSEKDGKSRVRFDITNLRQGNPQPTSPISYDVVRMYL